jgi:hypothetical protein
MVVTSMCKARALSPQDRRFILDLKEALAVPHRGAEGMPRKAVWSALGKSESWYSLVLDPETHDLPGLIDLRKIATLTGNTEPLRVLARWWGEGHELAEVDPHHLLTSSIQADGLFSGQLAKALEDDQVEPHEAREILPSAEARLHQAQATVDNIKKLARRR